MLCLLISLLIVGAEVSATSPKRPPPKCPFPSGPYVPPDCGPNAYFEVCSYPCPPQNCSTLWTKYRCKEECCRPECRCKDGYLRDDRTGLCISRDECLAPCGPSECFVRDSRECQKTCANYKVTGPESLCKPFTGCVCKEGLVRLYDDGTGPCVPPKKCPKRICPLHEHWNECPSICLKETCISKSPDYKCLLPAIPLPCKPRCICDKGYLRDHFGRCIPENLCLIKRCPPNEVWRCAAPCAQDSCKRLEPGFRCPPGVSSVCLPACTCKDGYLRNDLGFCIPRELCPASLRCGINEVAVECETVWPPQTCESVYTVYKSVDDVPCNPGCDCRPGYLRNQRNICVPSEFCPSVPPNKCGPNQEYLKCGNACQPSCADLNAAPHGCSDECVAGCFCVQGYYRDGQGNCVPRDQCPLPVCWQPNEVAKDCGSYCEIKTCEDYKRTDISCPAVCVRGCFCLDGYVRNAYGVCVLPQECPPEPVCLQKNEEYLSCGSSCPDTCDNYKDTNRICTANCVAGCYCKKGYVRNLKDKTCVKPEQCPTKECMGENEEWHTCASYCPVTCANRFTLGDWGCITLCREACDCIPGTLRNDNGTCVPVEHCTPPVCRENEKYMKCGTACPLTCDNYKNPPLCTQQCVEDCFCQDGYVRDRNMRCVKPENCEPICPLGEKFDECSAHCQDTCENYNNPNRICTYQCQSGCVCESGTVRRKDGACVPPCECFGTMCLPDEVYDPCSSHCEPTCERHEPDRPCTDVCKPGCRCRDGLVRQNDGSCVRLEDCKHICPIGETFSPCSAHCQDTCENYNNPNRICTKQCQPGCVCNKGTVRRKDGLCVKPGRECISNECSDPNAERVDCGIAISCRPTCAVPNPGPCILQACIPNDCVCKPGHILDDGKCIPKNQCKKPTCPSGEKYDACYAHCQDTCENYSKPNRPCTHQCQPGCVCDTGTVRRKDGQCVPPSECHAVVRYAGIPNDCVCKPGYILDDGKCIPKNQRKKPTCPSGEKYDACYAHCQDTCENYSNPNRPCTHQCQPGCVCDTGTVRRKDGQCVPPSECHAVVRYTGIPNDCVCKPGYILDDGKCIPKNQRKKPTCPSGEKYDACYAHCQDTCENYSNPNRPCTHQCQPGCVCDTGTVRRKDGQCVPPSECQHICPAGETFSECSAHCQDTCENYKDPNRICTRQCQPGCVCNKGTVRRKDGLCVKPGSACTSDECSDPNAERVPCGLVTWCRPSCAVPNPKPCKSEVCIPNDCVCKPGYVLDDGKCVPPSYCGIQKSCNGDPNAVIRECPQPCPATCALPDVKPCPKPCEPVGCQCKEGYILSENGRCVLPDNCKGGNPCGANEIFVSCKVPCPSDYCPVISSPNTVTCETPDPCYPGCTCKPNYLLRSKDDPRCIYAPECPPLKCGKNEEWSGCPSPCLKEECWYVDDPPTEPCLIGDSCRPRCICKKGYYRNTTTIERNCIPAKQCPPKPCGLNEHYEENSHRCQWSCDDYHLEPIAGPCEAYSGCFCDRGLVRNKDRKCVPKDQCPKKCGPNEHYETNRVKCELTCKNYKLEHIMGPCVAASACFCDDGFVRDKHWKCVRKTECPGPMICPPNEVFSDCYNTCHMTCKTRLRSDGRVCPAACLDSGCLCVKGYLRHDNGTCVPVSQCSPPVCWANETYSPCGSACPPTCRSRGDTCRVCTAQCVEDCFCDKGLVRADDGRCVAPQDCPPRTCSDPNEVFVDCPPTCPPTDSCANIWSKFDCDKYPKCCKPQCRCRSGYARNRKGVCITTEQCINGGW